MAVQFSEFTFESASGCNTLTGGIWCTDEKPKAVVQLVHGMCEYIGRYDAFARFLAEKGMAVIGNDHLGHGKSAGTAGELGFFAKKDGYALVVEDVHSITVTAQKKWPDTPIFMLGHSMGSFIAQAYLGKYGSELSGAVISGTGGPNPILGAAMLIVNTTALFRGEHYRSAFIDNLAFGSYCKRIPDSHSAKDWISSDREIVNKYTRDPYCMYTFTASAFRDLFRMIKASTDKALPERIPKQLPILYIAGTEDPVGDYGKGPRIMADRMKNAGIEDVELKLYEGMRHETLNEVGKQQVYDDVLGFIEGHIQ